jgi:exodeoxyribonuclease VII large subunit
MTDEDAHTARRALVLERKRAAAALDCRSRRPRELERLALALAAHDPQRTLERGYALVQSPSGEPVSSAAAARAQAAVRLRFADGAVAARIEEDAARIEEGT